MAASGLVRTAAPSKADPYVAKFTGKKIRTFKFNYARIFGLKESGFVTIDPGTFEVTNTFDYADVTNLKMGKDALRFEFKSKQHGAMEFESTFRAHLLTELVRLRAGKVDDATLGVPRPYAGASVINQCNILCMHPSVRPSDRPTDHVFNHFIAFIHHKLSRPPTHPFHPRPIHSPLHYPFFSPPRLPPPPPPPSLPPSSH